MAITARSLRRIEAWSDWQAAGGTRLSVVDDAIAARASVTLQNEQLLVTLPLDSPAIPSLGARKVIRIDQADGVFDEYKIIERAVDDSQGMWSITAAPLRLTDLAGCGLISRKDSDGVIVYDFEVLGLTPTQIITNWILPVLSASGYGWIAVGNITPTAVMDMTFAWDTPLSALIRLASATQSEIDLRRSGTGSYVIDIVTKINSSVQQADIRVDKNLVNITRTESSVAQATRVFPKGSVQDEMAGTMARAVWLVSGLAGSSFILSDPAGGKPPIQFPDQISGKYIRKVDGTLTAIVSSDSTTQVVTVASATGIANGDLIQVRADSVGADLTYLDNPAAIAAYGIKLAIREVPDVPATNNLIKNPVMRTWPGTLPINWTAVNAPTTAKQVVAPFTVLGGASIKVTSLSDGQGVVSDAVSIFPTAANPYVSGFAKVWVASGNCRVELLFTTPSGTKVFPVLPDVASAPVLGQWVDLGESGFDANAAGATAVAVRVVQHTAANAVFYVDAAQVTATATQQPFFEGSGATRLWQEANAALVAGSTPVASYIVPLADLETYDPVTWSESALVIGANARIVDPRLSIDIVTRIVGIERDYIQPENVSVTLSNRPEDLSDILAATSRPDRGAGASDEPLLNPQQPKLSASFDINGQLIINSFGDNDVTSQKIAWATGSAPSAATVRAASATLQQNISGLATGSIYAQGTTVFIAAFAYNSRGFESSPLAVVSESRQGAIIDYTPFASNLTPVKIVSVLPGSGAFLGEIVFLTTDKKLYRWDGAVWLSAVAATDITGQIQTGQIADAAITAVKIGAAAVTAGKIAAGAVGSNEIAAAAIVATKVAVDAISITKILDAAAGRTGNFFNETWDKLTAWDFTIGSTNPTLIAGGSSGANVLRASGYVWGIWAGGSLPFNPLRLYRLRTRYRATTNASVPGNALIYIGLVSTDISGAATNTNGGYDYVIQSAGTTTVAAGWVELETWVKGATKSNATGSQTPSTDPRAPSPLGIGTAFVRPMCGLNYPSGDGVYELDYIVIEEMSDVPGGQIKALSVTAAELAAASVTAGKIAALSITAAEIAANAITASKIAAGSVTTEKLTVGAIQNSVLLNGSFEEVSAADATMAAQWIRAFVFGGTGATLSTADRVSGDRCMDLNPGSGALVDIAPASAIPVVPGETWYISAQMKGHGSGVSGIYFRFRGGSTATDTSQEWGYNFENQDVATSWTRIDNVAVVPAGVYWARPLILNYTTNTGKGVYVDDVTMQKVVVSAYIGDGQIITAKLAANSVTAAKIAADTITAAEIAAGAITSSELAAGAVIAGKIAALTIVAGDIAAATITGAKIAATTITASNLVANTITAGQIQAGAIGTTELAAGAVTAAKIAAGTITANEIAAATITGAQIAAGTITASNIVAGTITADRIVANSLTLGRMAVHRFRGRRTGAAITIGNNSVASCNIDTVDDDPDGLSGGGGFTVPTGGNLGIWWIHGRIRWDSNTTGARMIQIRDAGILSKSSSPAITYTDPDTAVVGGVELESFYIGPLSVGSVIVPYGWQNSGANRTILSGSLEAMFFAF